MQSKRVIYPDGSSVETLSNGAMLIREGKPAPIGIAAFDEGFKSCPG